MKKRKIVFYIDSLNRGGTEKATVDLVNHLNQDKYEITLIRLFPGGEYRKDVKKEIKVKTIVPVIQLFSKRGKIRHRLIWWSRRILEKIPGKIRHKILIGSRYDVEVACGYFYPTKFIEDSPNAKKISWVHMDYTIDKSDIGNFTKKEGQKFFGKMDQIVCVSKECEKKFNEKFELDDKTITKYNIIDVNNILSKAEELNPIEYSNEFINVVTIGRLTWQKGYDRLLKVHKQLIDKGIMHNLYIVGEGEEYKNLLEYIKTNNLNETVFLLGYKSNPYPYIKKADIFVCSSRHESFSLVVAESLVLGTPVLSTSCAGPNELLDNGKYGMIVENGEKYLYEGLKKILTNTELRQELKRKALERKIFFDTKNAVRRWEEILDE